MIPASRPARGSRLNKKDKIRKDMEIVAEVRQLQQERKNYEITKEWKHKPEHPNKDSDAI
jgi:hypothetical protein